MKMIYCFKGKSKNLLNDLQNFNNQNFQNVNNVPCGTFNDFKNILENNGVDIIYYNNDIMICSLNNKKFKVTITEL